MARVPFKFQTRGQKRVTLARFGRAAGRFIPASRMTRGQKTRGRGMGMRSGFGYRRGFRKKYNRFRRFTRRW